MFQDLELLAGSNHTVCPGCTCLSDDCNCKLFVHTDGNKKLSRRIPGQIMGFTADNKGEMIVDDSYVKVSKFSQGLIQFKHNCPFSKAFEVLTAGFKDVSHFESYY